MRALRNFAYLWRSRHDHGFPWPFRHFGGGWQPWITGYSRYSPVPAWRQIVRIPGPHGAEDDTSPGRDMGDLDFQPRS